MSDYFTKWTEAFALPNMGAKTIARTIMVQGRQYESKVFLEMCRLLGITNTGTSPYHPKSDSMTERFKRTLISMLSVYVQENQRVWLSASNTH